MLSFFGLDVLDEIWDLIESVSEGFLTLYLILLKSIQGRKQEVTKLSPSVNMEAYRNIEIQIMFW